METHPGGSSDEEGHKEKGRPRQLELMRSSGISPTSSAPDGNERSLGLSGIMKVYLGKKPFSDSWCKDLSGSFVVFATLSHV